MAQCLEPRLLQGRELRWEPARFDQQLHILCQHVHCGLETLKLPLLLCCRLLVECLARLGLLPAAMNLYTTQQPETWKERRTSGEGKGEQPSACNYPKCQGSKGPRKERGKREEEMEEGSVHKNKNKIKENARLRCSVHGWHATLPMLLKTPHQCQSRLCLAASCTASPVPSLHPAVQEGVATQRRWEEVQGNERHA